MPDDRAGERTTVVMTAPKTGVDVVSCWRKSAADAERVAVALRGCGLRARCEPWKPADAQGHPWTAR